MKKLILFFLLVCSVAAQAQQKQSLKDLLYGGKLRLDSNAVIRKDDDLSAKIDTAARRPAPMDVAKVETPKTTAEKINAAATEASTAPVTAEGSVASDSAAVATETTAAPAAVVKSNTRIWKEYTDSLISGLKSEVLSSKKIKKETYYVIAEYELGTDGSVNVLNVTSSPESALLQSEIKNRLDNAPPKLSPVLDSAGQPRKVKRKQSFTVIKE